MHLINLLKLYASEVRDQAKRVAEIEPAALKANGSNKQAELDFVSREQQVEEVQCKKPVRGDYDEFPM